MPCHHSLVHAEVFLLDGVHQGGLQVAPDKTVHWVEVRAAIGQQSLEMKSLVFSLSHLIYLLVTWHGADFCCRSQGFSPATDLIFINILPDGAVTSIHLLCNSLKDLS